MPGSRNKTCVVCGEITVGSYYGFPVCLDCYESEKLPAWLFEIYVNNKITHFAWQAAKDHYEYNYKEIIQTLLDGDEEL